MIEKSSDNPSSLVLIGGGTGSFTLLQELKYLTPDITAVVNMSDDGGSSGRLRDEFGVLPPGDVRQCLVALSNQPNARDLFSYRFGGDGELAGQSAGNIMLSALEMQFEGDFIKALDVASSILGITGKVVPVTTIKHTLVMQDGKEDVRGEFCIAHRPFSSPSPRVRHDPPASICEEAESAINQADIVAIAPGNLYGSIIPALAVNGMSEALRQTKATKVLVANLVNKPGQTDDWHVVDYIHELEKYTGDDMVDIALYNDKLPSLELLKKYAKEGEMPVDTEQIRFKEVCAKTIGAPLIADTIFLQNPNDTAIHRTLIRHDASQVVRELSKIADTNQNNYQK